MYYGAYDFLIYIVILLVTVMLIKNDKECICNVRFSGIPVFHQVLTGIVLASILVFPLVALNGALFHSFSAFQFLKLNACARINFFTFQLIVAITEEFLYRGYLLCIIKKITKASAIAILSTAILFAGIHFVLKQDLVKFLVALIIGFLFAIAYDKGKYCSIYSLVLAHLLYNLAIINV